MTKEDLKKFMLKLAKSRPVFHSEDDFKFELAFLLRKEKFKVRLERPFYLKDKTKIKLDIEVNGNIAIELKYKKASFKKEINDEIFEFNNDGAFPYNRYDFVKDAWRVRSLIDENQHKIGFTIVLVNEEKYWEPVKDNSIDKDFVLINSTKFLKGKELKLTGKKESKKRPPIKINFNDEINWYDYSEKGTFKFFIIDVNR